MGWLAATVVAATMVAGEQRCLQRWRRRSGRGGMLVVKVVVMITVALALAGVDAAVSGCWR